MFNVEQYIERCLQSVFNQQNKENVYEIILINDGSPDNSQIVAENFCELRLFNIYLFANAFWILVIRANFSNRFAFLSWFLLALVICYPWLKFYFEKNQHRKLGMIMLAYFGFTYLMNIILK